jgi:hypothetical protein
VLVKKRIALSLRGTDLINDHVALVHKRALLLPLSRRAPEGAIAKPARVEEVFRTVPPVGEELLGKRPGFAADLAVPPGQIRLARIQFRALSP